jgi:coenzyme PQQ synthesis protein D (PqqD)
MPFSMAFALTDRATVPDGVVSRELDGETVLLNLETGMYFGLDAVGTDMWRAIREAATLGEALTAVRGQYDVDETTIRTDFLQLADELLAKGLLQRADSEPPSAG